MKFKSVLLAFFFVTLMFGAISCSQTDISDDINKKAIDTIELIQKKFDNTKILVNNLSDQGTNENNIQKILDITTDFIEKDIPEALNTLKKTQAPDAERKVLSKKILLIKKEVQKTRRIAVKKAADEAKSAALFAIAEKEKVQKAQEELENAKIDADFVQTNMPKTLAAKNARDAAHAARLKTLSYCRILEKFPKERSYAKIKTYAAQAESSAIEADNFAKRAVKKYQNILHTNKNLAREDLVLTAQIAANKAHVDVEAAEMAVQEILINMSLALRLFTHDLKNIYTIAYAIEKSVHAINLAQKSVKDAEDLSKAAVYDTKLLASRACLKKTHAAFESHIKSVSEALLKIIKENFKQINNSDSDINKKKAAQIVLNIALDNLRLSSKYMKIFEQSLISNLKNAHVLLKENLKVAKKYRSRARKVQSLHASI